MKEMLRTDRLEIRPFSDHDREELSDLLLNDDIKKTYMIPDLADQKALDAMLDRFVALSRSDRRIMRGVYLGERLIGFVNEVEIQNGCLELGYAIHPTFWGQGYATEMLRAMLDELLGNPFSAIQTGAFAENVASMRVMEKCGMQRIDKTEDIEYRGTCHACVYYEARA